jgi:hypothetical protein
MPVPLTASAVLDAWEAGRLERIGDRSPSLLPAVGWLAVDEAGELTVGQCDRLLVDLRVALFGPELDIVTSCPSCREQVEFALDADQLRAPALDGLEARVPALVMHDGALRVTLRPPTNADLRAVAPLDADPEAEARALVRRCVQEVRDDRGPLPAEAEALAPVLKAPLDVLEQLARVDAAVTELSISCACGHEWVDEFDIRTFLWSELSEWAQRLLFDVHDLASAYGWTEHDILGLSPWRRQAYLEACAG